MSLSSLDCILIKAFLTWIWQSYKLCDQKSQSHEIHLRSSNKTAFVYYVCTKCSQAENLVNWKIRSAATFSLPKSVPFFHMSSIALVSGPLTGTAGCCGADTALFLRGRVAYEKAFCSGSWSLLSRVRLESS